MDEDGYLKIVGRAKDTVIRGGENVYPTEIEIVLAKHPDIVEGYVFGVPDERLGEELCAWIRTSSPLNEADVKAYCKKACKWPLANDMGSSTVVALSVFGCYLQLASYKVPKYVKFMKEGELFPTTPSDKVQKYKMREIAVEALKINANTVEHHDVPEESVEMKQRQTS